MFFTQGINMASVDSTYVLELTRERIAQQLGHEARRCLAISSEELVRRYRTGHMKDCG